MSRLDPAIAKGHLELELKGNPRIGLGRWRGIGWGGN